ncbi:MAG: septal ring lytic transglycosylase RlpA family protein [Pseudomonadota bacterium]
MARLTHLPPLAAIAALLGACAGAPPPAGAPARPAKPAAAAPGAANDPARARAAATLPAPVPGSGAYYQDDGPAAVVPPDLDKVPDAEARVEPLSKYANRPYVVFGKRYVPMTDGAAFSQRGQGSWYGKKFHGQRTASGEIYDMYKMSAAHPTLPIPSYARVTSVASGRQVVVRINDRGPFHKGRVVDVSYTAAVKLGLLSSGSHEVSVERLLPADIARIAAGAPERGDRVVPEGADAGADAVQEAFFLQLGAFGRAGAAESLRERLVGLGVEAESVKVLRGGAVHRVLSGPYPTRAEAAEAARELPGSLALKPVVVRR